MRNLRLNPIVFVFAVLALMSSSFAQAQATRTWVSGVGDDANPCSRTAPCKTFAGAISKTAAAGEINVLDPGGFGAVTITKSITIDGGGFIAGVLVNAGSGILINAGAADVVTLRGLDINGLKTAVAGVKIIAAGAVHIDKSVIYGFNTEPGIEDIRSGAGKLIVTDTVVRDNAQTAIVVAPGAAVSAILDRVRLVNNGNSGVVALANATITISNSDVAGSTNFGLYAENGGTINSENTRVVSNGSYGLVTISAGAIRISNTSILNNGASYFNAGIIYSFNNNRIAGNSGASSGFLTSVAQE